MSELIERSEHNAGLALCLWSRPDVPRRVLMNLLPRVSDEVRTALELARPREVQNIRAAVAVASERIQTDGTIDRRSADRHFNRGMA